MRGVDEERQHTAEERPVLHTEPAEGGSKKSHWRGVVFRGIFESGLNPQSGDTGQDAVVRGRMVGHNSVSGRGSQTHSQNIQGLQT